MRRKICCLFSEGIPYRMGERKQMSKDVTKRKRAKNAARKPRKALKRAAEEGREPERMAYSEVEKIAEAINIGKVDIDQLKQWNGVMKKYKLTAYRIPKELLL